MKQPKQKPFIVPKHLSKDAAELMQSGLALHAHLKNTLLKESHKEIHDLLCDLNEEPRTFNLLKDDQTDFTETSKDELIRFVKTLLAGQDVIMIE